MPPRQRTTFKNKKPTTTYSYVEDRPTSASERLDTFIRSNQDKKNQSPGLESILQDMPEKRADFVRRQLEKTGGRLNEAAKAMLAPYQDDRSQYSREMNRLRTSSPEMMDAYAKRFPVENFAMKMGPTLAGAVTGIPFGLLERGFDKTKSGFDFAKSGVGKGLDAILSGIDKGMTTADDALYNIATGIEYDTPVGDILSGDLKDKAIDIFQDAIAEKEDDYTFSPQNVPGSGGGVNFRDNFNSLNTSTDTPESELLFRVPGVPGYMIQKNPNLGPTSAFSSDVNRFVDLPNYPGTFVTSSFNQGGLASLNNKDYMRLMSASNFGF